MPGPGGADEGECDRPRRTPEDHEEVRDGNAPHGEAWIPQPVRRCHAAGMRGVAGDVPVLRGLRRAAPRHRRAPLLVLELDALPDPDARIRRDLHRLALPGGRVLAEPGLRRAAGDGNRLPGGQRLHLHLGQPGHRSGEDRRARRLLPEARRLLLRELDRAVREVAHEDGGAHCRARRASGAGAPRVRARRGRVLRRSQHRLLRGPRGLRALLAARRPDVAAPLRVPAPRLRGVRHVRRPVQGEPARHPRPAHRPDGRRDRRPPLPARRGAAAPRSTRTRGRGRRGLRGRQDARRDRGASSRPPRRVAAGSRSSSRSRIPGSTWRPATD